MGKTKKWLLIILLLLSVFANKIAIAQDSDKWGFTNNGYTRGNGFVIRPELYSGLFATLGYQINPYVQLSGGIGFGLDQYGGVITTFGIRTYTSDANWAAMFDYHIGFLSIQGLNLARHTIVGGASYKDFDFGAGLMYVTDGYDSGIGFSITLGFNIRCYEHR